MWLINVVKLTVLWVLQNLEWFLMLALLVAAYQIGFANGGIYALEMVQEMEMGVPR